MANIFTSVITDPEKLKKRFILILILFPIAALAAYAFLGTNYAIAVAIGFFLVFPFVIFNYYQIKNKNSWYIRNAYAIGAVYLIIFVILANLVFRYLGW